MRHAQLSSCHAIALRYAELGSSVMLPAGGWQQQRTRCWSFRQQPPAPWLSLAVGQLGFWIKLRLPAVCRGAARYWLVAQHSCPAKLPYKSQPQAAWCLGPAWHHCTLALPWPHPAMVVLQTYAGWQKLQPPSQLVPWFQIYGSPAAGRRRQQHLPAAQPGRQPCCRGWQHCRLHSRWQAKVVKVSTGGSLLH